MHIPINLQKLGMPLYLAFLIVYFDNYSHQMLMYSLMHGSYGVLWYVKHVAFPDETFKTKFTIGCTFILWTLVLGPYMVPAYLIAAKIAPDESENLPRLYWSGFVYVMGVSLTLLADAQKNYTLKLVKQRPILINDGFCKYTRNPNYLGEMMLYLAFALCCNHWLAYLIIVWVWSSLFAMRMFQKEMSLKQKPGWKAYSQQSWILLPKINGRTLDSIVLYSALVSVIAYYHFK